MKWHSLEWFRSFLLYKFFLKPEPMAYQRTFNKSICLNFVTKGLAPPRSLDSHFNLIRARVKKKFKALKW